MRSLVGVFALGALVLAGCSRCNGTKRGEHDAARGDTPFEIAPAPLVEPWRWQQASARDMAVPAGCRFTASPQRFATDTTRLFFMSPAGDPNTLAVAEGLADGGTISRARGLVSMPNESGVGGVRDVPWIHVDEPPVMASTGARFLSVLREADAFGPTVRLWLWRDGKPLEVLGDGDQLAATDARCDGESCVVLTTRASAVASPGATVWFGDASDAASSFARKDVAPEGTAKAAAPFAIARWDAASRAATIAIDSGGKIAFFAVKPDAIQGLGGVPKEHLVLDVVATKTTPLLVTTRGEPDDDGCVAQGAKVVLAAPGREAIELSSATPPASGYARPLGPGAFVTWIAPVNCKAPERKVVYGVLIGEDGVPASTPMALGNADGHAMTTSGMDVSVWLREPGGVTWIRMRCALGGMGAPAGSSSATAPLGSR